MKDPDAIDTAGVAIPAELVPRIDQLAAHIHSVWAARRRGEGWTWGPERDDPGLRHPNLVPYAELSDAEKAYDRETAAETIRCLLALGYRIERVDEPGLD